MTEKSRIKINNMQIDYDNLLISHEMDKNELTETKEAITKLQKRYENTTTENDCLINSIQFNIVCCLRIKKLNPR